MNDSEDSEANVDRQGWVGGRKPMPLKLERSGGHVGAHGLRVALQSLSCMSHEEDTCMSYEEEDTCMSYEEEDTCMSYEEEDT